MGKVEEIIIQALKAEALQKPNEKIIAGKEILTYREFAEILDSKKLQQNHKKLVDAFLKSAVKLFNENPTYKQHIMKLAGVET
jgi:hypothetical protein